MTELEGCILGVIARASPLTAYAVRKVFHASVTTHWKASAGAIYPVVEKLIARGLVRRSEITGNARGGSLLHLTDKGTRALRAWVASADDDLASALADPIRTRVHFLSLVDPAERARLLGQWIAATDTQIARARAGTAADPWEAIATKGLVGQLSARRDWLVQTQCDLAQAMAAV